MAQSNMAKLCSVAYVRTRLCRCSSGRDAALWFSSLQLEVSWKKKKSSCVTMQCEAHSEAENFAKLSLYSWKCGISISCCLWWWYAFSFFDSMGFFAYVLSGCMQAGFLAKHPKWMNMTGLQVSNNWSLFLSAELWYRIMWNIG